ncbi:hypothetical protein [Desulfolucanica intricata]|uniref:hypothetical protein n=1 Tax=Desulfolucanica intricata TaxID=1285191 RepID=UPI000AB82CA5|nr:hypothetical protein [Desulfolucanica intricata]
MKETVSDKSLNFSRVNSLVSNENSGRQVKRKTTGPGAVPRFQLNNLGGPLEEDFKLHD